jgi:hypothetical protein
MGREPRHEPDVFVRGCETAAMRPRDARLVSALVAAAALAGVVGCGGDDDGPEPPQHRAETVDKLPKLPAGWHKYVNHRAGFAIGMAPGWRAERDGTSTLLRSPDRLVAISISADRTAEAVEFPLDDYAEQALEALPRFDHLKSGKAHLFKAHYQAEAVNATGRSHGGVRQQLTFIAMRRKDLATYAVLVARNAERDTRFYEREALRIVRTLRGRPIG